MKKVYICGSLRFAGIIEELETRLKKEKVECLASKNTDVRGISGCLEKIDNADVVYIVNPEGYIGKSVSIDIGYAYAKNKSIYAMHSIDDPPVMGMIKGILSFEELISFLKHRRTTKA